MFCYISFLGGFSSLENAMHVCVSKGFYYGTCFCSYRERLQWGNIQQAQSWTSLHPISRGTSFLSPDLALPDIYLCRLDSIKIMYLDRRVVRAICVLGYFILNYTVYEMETF
jgi:hypothetical protein